MGGTGSGPQLTLPDKILRSKLTIAALYPDALQAIKEAVHPPTPLELRFQAGKWLAEMHDGKPTQRQANADGSNLPAPVIAIQIVAPLGTSPLPYVQVRELGPVPRMPQDATGEAREAFEGGEAPVLPIRVSPPSKRKSPPPASMGTTRTSQLIKGGQVTPPPVPPAPHSPGNLYGFGAPAPADGPGGVLRLSKDAAPNSREARYAQRQARLRALMGQQGR